MRVHSRFELEVRCAVRGPFSIERGMSALAHPWHLVRSVKSEEGNRRIWRLGKPRLTDVEGWSRVTASIGGHEVWFECRDAPLCEAPEAFASAFFIQALAAGATIQLEAPVDARWLEGVQGLLPVYRDWWGYAGRHPIEAAATSPSIPPQPRERGLCFTGGVDSFHALLRTGAEIDRLVYVQGYDIRLDEPPRMAAWEKSLREIAAEHGKEVAIVRTNLREIPLFNRISWVRTHGAALAAVGHVLSGRLDQLQIPSSFRYEREIPWGSSWRTDPLWSDSRVKIRHLDATLGRHHKLVDISAEPIVWRHLRVCWERRSQALNCSRCEKCLRTMLILERLGLLKEYSVFDHSRELPELLDGLHHVPAELVAIWKDMAEERLPPAARAAVDRLLQRSIRRASWSRFRARFRFRR